jgi:hypothetical protein
MGGDACGPGELRCPRKHGVIAEEKCLQWQREKGCYISCAAAVTDPFRQEGETEEERTEKAREKHKARRWRQIRHLLSVCRSTVTAQEAYQLLDFPSPEAADALLRFYERRGELRRKNSGERIEYLLATAEA